MIPFLDSPWVLAEALIGCWCLTLYIPKKHLNLTWAVSRTATTNVTLPLSKHHLRDDSAEDRIRACRRRIFKCKNMSMSFLGFSCFLKLVCRRINGYLTQAYIPFVQPHPQDGKCHNKKRIKSLKESNKKVSCTQNVQPMFVTEQKRHSTQPHTRPRSFIPIHFKALNVKSFKHAIPFNVPI